MRTCSLGYCTDIVWLSIIVILSLCLTLWKSHFIFSLGFNLFCALRNFSHSVTFTAAFSVFLPFPQMEPKGTIHLEERFAFIFHIKKRGNNLKIPLYQLALNRGNVFTVVVSPGCASGSVPAALAAAQAGWWCRHAGSSVTDLGGHSCISRAAAPCRVSMVAVTVLQLPKLEGLSSGFRGKRHSLLIQRLLIFTVFGWRESYA